MIPFPQTEKLPSPVSDVWEDGAAGQIVSGEVFAQTPATVGFHSVLLLAMGLGAALASGTSAEAAIVDRPDQVAATAQLPIAANASLTDRPDVVVSTASVAVTGNAQVTDRPDGVSGAASAGVTGNVAAIDQPDGVASTASLAVSASAALQDRPDGVSASATSSTLIGFRSLLLMELGGAGRPAVSPLIGTLSAFDQPDTASATASLGITGNAAATDQPDRLNATASFNPMGFRSLLLMELGGAGMTSGPPPFVANLTAFDQPDRVASTAGPGVLLTSINGTSDYRITASPDLEVGDRIEVLSAVGGAVSEVTILPDATFSLSSGSTVTSFVVRVWSISEQAWGDPATQYVELFAAAAITDRPDTLTSQAQVTVTATLTAVDRPDSVTAAATLGSIQSSGDAALQDRPDSVAATASVAVTANATVTDLPDTLSAAAALSITANAAIVDRPDAVNATAGVLVVSVFDAAIFDAADALAASASLSIVGNVASVDQPDWVQAAGFTRTITFNAAFSDQPDIVLAAAILNIPGVSSRRVVRVDSASRKVDVSRGARIVTVDGKGRTVS